MSDETGGPELHRYLSLDVFESGKILADVLAELDAMSPEAKADLNRGMADPFDFDEVRAELLELIGTHGGRAPVTDFVRLEP